MSSMHCVTAAALLALDYGPGGIVKKAGLTKDQLSLLPTQRVSGF